MKLIYGTFNPAKFNSMVQMTEGLGIELTSLNEIKGVLIESEENGADPLSNAQEKALNYYRQLKQPVFSCDSGLYFKEVEAYEQPGVKIRRVGEQRLNDQEMMQHYMKLAEKYEGKLTAFYKNAICLILDENTIVSYDGERLESEPFYLVNQAHSKVIEGFPLDSLSVHIKSGKYYYDIEETEQEDEGIKEGIQYFFKQVLL